MFNITLTSKFNNPNLIKLYHFLGGVGIVKNGEVIYEKYGFSNLQHQIPFSDCTGLENQHLGLIPDKIRIRHLINSGVRMETLIMKLLEKQNNLEFRPGTHSYIVLAKIIEK